jgi:hypothetical protein
MEMTDAGADEALVAYTFRIDERTEVRAYVQPYNGKLFAHIRHFKRWNEQGEYKPAKGIRIPVDRLQQLVVAAAMLAAQHGEAGA